MNALRFEQGRLQLANVPVPARDGEVLVRVTLAGICNTDIEIIRGYANFSGTLGHEFVGIVEQADDGSLIGQRVVGEINVGCGECDECLRRLSQKDARHCRHRNVLGIRERDGAFAEYLNLPGQNLLRVPELISDYQAVFTEPLAAACAILEQITLTPSHRIAVIGDGKLGQLIARVLVTTGCDLMLIGKHDNKLELARAAGVKAQTLSEVKPAADFEVVVEASGSVSGLELALDLVRPRGVVVLKSTIHSKVELDSSRIIVNEIKLLGSRCGRFAEALELLAHQQVEVESLIACEFPLTDGIAAMNKAQERGVLKVLLRP